MTVDINKRSNIKQLSKTQILQTAMALFFFLLFSFHLQGSMMTYVKDITVTLGLLIFPQCWSSNKTSWGYQCFLCSSLLKHFYSKWFFFLCGHLISTVNWSLAPIFSLLKKKWQLNILVTICPAFTGTDPVFDAMAQCQEYLSWEIKMSQFLNNQSIVHK